MRVFLVVFVLFMTPSLAQGCEVWQYDTMYVADQCPPKPGTFPQNSGSPAATGTEYNGHPNVDAPDPEPAPAPAPAPAAEAQGEGEGEGSGPEGR